MRRTPWRWPTAWAAAARVRSPAKSRFARRGIWRAATTSWLMKLQDLNTEELTERVEGFVYMMQQAFVEEFATTRNSR